MTSLENKTVLLTGASGFIGSHLASRLKDITGIRLLLLSRKSYVNDDSKALWVKASLTDLTNDFWLQNKITKIDVVFHLGAFTPKSTGDANRVQSVFEDNLTGTRSLIESLPSAPERIVFASTLDVYAPSSTKMLLDEATPSGPATLYGASKLFCEYLVQTFAIQIGCKYSILRYGHIFGPGEEAYKKLIPQMIRSLLRGESPAIYGDGSVKRDFLYIDDAVEATLRASVSDEHYLGPVNIVRGTSSTIRSIAETLVRSIDVSREISYLKNEPQGCSLHFDNSFMKEALGTWNLIGLEEGLKREVDYFRSMSQ